MWFKRMLLQRNFYKENPTLLKTRTNHLMDAEEPALTSLPDVAALRVLSFLAVADLYAVAVVSPRLRALMRAHRALWRHRRARLRGPEALAAVLRVAPPWDTLELRVRARADLGDGDTDRDRSSGGAPSPVHIDMFTSRMLVVTVFSAPAAVELVARLGRQAKHLKIYLDTPQAGAGAAASVGPLMQSLRQARALETLCVRWDWSSPVSPEDAWPPNSVLPSLHTVDLECPPRPRGVAPAGTPAAVELSCLRELLLAHRAQLHCAALRSPELLPLLQLLPDHLLRLTVAVDPGLGNGAALTAGLKRMHSLKELKFVRMEEEHKLAGLLRSWQGPLQCLKLPACSEETARALGAGALSRLEHLHLNGIASGGAPLAAALAGLPRLRTLVLRTPPAPDVLRAIPAATVPALCLLYIMRDPSPSGGPSPASASATALRDLVLRAPKSLHVIRPALALPSGDAPPAPATAPARSARPTHIYGRHPPDESDLCPGCVEARATSKLLMLSPGRLHYVCVTPKTNPNGRRT
ncbi:Type II iodothyronine deiodinase [Frankliniella fusca]|uniref:Type II iodothyronine deiodinase n=1 Tax=Frankliniella fusca TaxID=407009 RepID=A0AAE1HN49_9NEOP|nr:Type II iodothyronine deiodinase [Frankliniella fusca]